MSKLKVNEIEDNTGGSVRLASNVNVEGDNSAAKNLTVSGTSSLTGNVACSGNLTASSGTTTLGTTNCGALTSLATICTSMTTQTLSAADASLSGNLTVSGSSTVQSLAAQSLVLNGQTIDPGLLNILKAAGSYTVTDASADVGTLAPSSFLGLADGSYDADPANDEATFTVAFTAALANTNYVPILTLSTTYAGATHLQILNIATTGFDVKIHTTGTDPTSSDTFTINLVVIG
ncbi:MAG: hypothetical protein VX951_08815 [Planctomycetota bacterium]|nr:hypothetical protein [Planctomycetota bacterium]